MNTEQIHELAGEIVERFERHLASPIASADDIVQTRATLTAIAVLAIRDATSELPECSICRRRHGAEVVHASE